MIHINRHINVIRADPARAKDAITDMINDWVCVPAKAIYAVDDLRD